METKADIGVIGLAVMGKNLILNIADHSYSIAVYNRTLSKVDDFVANEAKGLCIFPSHSIKEFVSLLQPSPRKILLMVKAGEVVDEYISQLLPFLEKGDIIIDGGNSNFEDSQRRYKELKEKGFVFVGMGISGGEEGARHGPSIMPGGDVRAWPFIQNIFQDIAARSQEGDVCCEWIGEGGSGHFVKMVHNGIEYGDMQLIAESYDLLKSLLGYSNDALSSVYKKWNEGPLASYLIEITAKIFKQKDPKEGFVIDHILDAAGQKGTGR